MLLLPCGLCFNRPAAAQGDQVTKRNNLITALLLALILLRRTG